MNTLKINSTGADVYYLQSILCDLRYIIPIDGIFGKLTLEAVCKFQRDEKLDDDGIVGKLTWAALENRRTIASCLELDFEKAASTLNVEVATIRAVHQVESGGRSGFLPDGRPLILFEGHCFWGQLKKMDMDPELFRAGNEDILFPKLDTKSYKGYEAEYIRLNRACVICHEAALMSASWGMFQIMGFNYELCGFDSVYKYCASMYLSRNNHLDAFVMFLKKRKLDVPLREMRWADFASGYNGKAYKVNDYDVKLEAAYNQMKIIYSDK